MSVDLGTAKGYLDLDISKFLSALNQAIREAKEKSKSASEKFAEGLSSAGKEMTGAGKKLSTAFTAPILGAGAASVKITSNFESAMSKVSAISGATGDDFVLLSDKAKEMGSKTKFSATEAAEAFQYMAMAGWKTGDMLDGIDGIMALSAADGLDLATTSDIVTDALTAFGLSAKDSGHFADVLAAASSNANTNVSMLGESFKYAAPVAGSLGYSAEDTAIALGLMANAGIKSSQGGTALRSSLSRLIKPTDEVAAAMDEYGIAITNSDGSMKSLGEVMDLLRGNLGGLTEAEQAQAAVTLFGQEAMSGMLAIINTSESDYNKLTSAVYDADGAAQQMADTMMNNLSGQITILKSTLEGLAIQFGEILLPYIKKGVEWLQNIVQKLQALSPEQKDQIVKIAAIVAAIGPLLITFGKIATGVSSIITVVSKLKTAFTAVKTSTGLLKSAFSFLTSPIGLVVTAVAALVAGLIHLWNTNEDFRNWVINAWNSIKDFFKNAIDAIKGFFTGFANKVKKTVDNIKSFFGNLKDSVAEKWEGIKTTISEKWEGIKTKTAEAMENIKEAMGVGLDAAKTVAQEKLENIKSAYSEAGGGINGIVAGAVEGVKSIWSFGLDWLNEITGGKLEALSTWWNNTLNIVSEYVSEFYTNVINFFARLAEKIATFFTQIYTNVTTWASNMISKAVELGSGFVDGIVSFFSSLPSTISGFISSVWSAIVTWASNMISKASQVGSNFLSNISSFFLQLPGKVAGYLSSALANVATWVSNMINKAIEAATGFLRNIGNTLVNLPSTIQGYLDSAISALSTWVTNMWNKGVEAINSLIDGVISAAAGIGNKVLSIGSDIVNGVWNGIVAAKDMFVGQVTSFFDGIIGSVKGFLGIGSPSKVFRDEVGKWIPPGISSGFEEAMPDATKDMQNALDDSIDDLDIDDISVGANSFGGLEKSVKQAFDGIATYFESMEKRIANSIYAIRQSLAGMAQSGLLFNQDGSLSYIGYNGQNGMKAVNQQAITQQPVDSSQRTYVFYSPKAIDEIEAAKQIKRTERELAEGFF